MRPALLLPLLAGAAVADEAQSPLDSAKATVQGWFNKAKSYIPSPSPVDGGASVVAAKYVHDLTAANWDETMVAPPADAEKATEWMILISGGNKTCPLRNCPKLDETFNKTAALLGGDADAPNLGRINCETTRLLCATLLAGIPNLWYIRLPPGGSSALKPLPIDQRPATELYARLVNHSTTTPQDMVEFYKEKKYAELPLAEGAFHPFDGWLVQYGLQKPMGWGFFLFSMVPSWGLMLVASFVSRNIMARRVTQQANERDAAVNRARAARAAAANKNK